MKALITGATGFIGSHLAEALAARGFDVTCLVRDARKLRFLEGLDLKLISGDCSDAVSLKNIGRFDYVFHLAGLTKAPSDEAAYVANETGTKNIAEAVLRDSPELKRFVYVSSLAAAGPSRDGLPVTETMEPAPVSVYGKSKLGGEKALLELRGRLPFTIIRPPAIYGPRDADLFLFFRMVKLGLVPYWGKSYYSFLYVDDLVNGIILSALHDAALDEIFFLSDGSIYSTDDIIENISVAMKRKPLKLRVPKFLMPCIGTLAEMVPGCNIINADKIRELQHTHWVCDSGRAADRLGFSPLVKITEGAQRTYEWYKVHNWL